MKNLKSLFAVAIVIATLSSCTSINRSMREPNTRVELYKSDFTLSDQVTAEAKSTKILGIDWKRLFTQKTGNIEAGSLAISLASIPVIGNYLADKTANYALYELMKDNEGYDVVFYPQYETEVKRPILGLGFIKRDVKVKVTARLAKVN